MNWEVQFTKGTSEQDKAIAMDSVRRYILHYLNGQKNAGLFLNQINITIPDLTDRDRAPIGVNLRFERAGKQATPPPPPPGGPGHPYVFPPSPEIPTNIPNINIMNAELK